MFFQELALALIRWENKNRDSCIETKKHLIDDSDRNKKENDTKMCVITRELQKFKDYKNYLKANSLENKINYLENN